MPQWMRRYLDSGSLKKHFWIALALGALARLLSAYFVYGPQALDDYKHGVWPAYQFFIGEALDLPSYRGRLLVWMLGFFVQLASYLDITSALGQVRAMYFGLGFISLSGLWGTYLFAKSQKTPRFGSLALYLVALFPLMPFISTRAFGEAVALSLVLLSFGYLESARTDERGGKLGSWIFGFCVLGLATLFRFHVGLIFVSYAVILFVRHHGRGVIGAIAGGLFAIVGQATIDVLSGKLPLATLFIYLAENEGGGAKYGVSPWYNPWLFVLGISLAPFSFVLWRAVRPLWKNHWPWIVPALLFVTAHSLVAHKEERFLYPILGLELWAVAYLWAKCSEEKWARRIYSPVILFLTALLLPATCLINTQEGEIEPPALTEQKYEKVVYLDHHSLFGKSRFQFYFLRPPSVLQAVGTEEFNAHRIDEALLAYPKHQAVVLLTSESDAKLQLDALRGIQTSEGRCLDVETSGSAIDRLIFRLNPKHNQRRRPTWYLVCERR